ncbi:hypothetical protein LS70_004900 [Helicobacter sp. MIT 11-5569]|uniref:hypothetical protein n=1 Tax=Helicobacter sp. MIT 11-5569 TaxID=1548151 RepID=UPI000AD2FDE9|nr:hypothetical protein [Helicobacter sp. MIT 11-5569]TLD83501.1 hypothetical protein LS70_004900 [Helicobacter sp. MIT 11-5569]
MKKLLFLLNFVCILGFLSACGQGGDDKAFLYKSSNCDDTKRDCLLKCRKDGKGQARCLDECEKVRGMCEAVKTKGCLQDCNARHGKNTPIAEQCKKRCQGL